VAKVSIEKHSEAGTLPETLWNRINTLSGEIRQRAFDLFEKRGRAAGQELDDWLQAERELVWSPPFEVIQNQDKLTVRITLPGFDAKDLEVTATPEALIVRAESTHTHEEKEGEVQVCECSGRKLFQRVELPSAIDVDKAAASLEKGILEFSAPKAVAEGRLGATA
jgi:HSP20 family protein